MTSGLPPEEADIVSTGRHVSKVPATDIRCLRCGWTKGSRAVAAVAPAVCTAQGRPWRPAFGCLGA